MLENKSGNISETRKDRGKVTMHVGVSRDCPNFFGYPLLSRERVKLRTTNLAGTFIGSI